MDFEQADILNEAIRAVGVRHRALAIAALAPFGIHPGHKLLLFELDDGGPHTQAALAAATGFEPPTITLSVRQLESAGLVVRRSDPGDRRTTLVELSDAGRALMPKLRAAWSELADEIVAGLTATPLEQLVDALSDLAASLDTLHEHSRDDPAREPAPALPRDIARRRAAGRRPRGS
jgi:DNA-binding MarR family transcriptional regulator